MYDDDSTRKRENLFKCGSMKYFYELQLEQQKEFITFGKGVRAK